MEDTLGAAQKLDRRKVEAEVIDVMFEVVFDTNVNQTIYVVGTWCDWDIEGGLQLQWTEGGVWKVGPWAWCTGAHIRTYVLEPYDISFHVTHNMLPATSHKHTA
jgi:hypothetical protein